MHSNEREEIKEAYAGHIVAAVGLGDIRTGDTLCDIKDPIVLERMTFPEPVISVAIEPKTKVDSKKLGEALSKLSREDPSFRAHTDDETGQTIISGMGELHLEIIVDRLKRELKSSATSVSHKWRIVSRSRATSKLKVNSKSNPVVAVCTATSGSKWVQESPVVG